MERNEPCQGLFDGASCVKVGNGKVWSEAGVFENLKGCFPRTVELVEIDGHRNVEDWRAGCVQEAGTRRP